MRLLFSLVLLLAAAALNSCRPDDPSASLGPLPKASFTISPLDGHANTFVASANTQGIFGWYWSPSSGATLVAGTASDTIHYPKHGNFRVQLVAVGHGGYDTATQIVQVASDDLSNNLIRGGQMTVDSAAAWTILNVGGTQTSINFTADGVNLSNGSNASTNGALFQKIHVLPGNYQFSAFVAGDGASNSWVEFYLGSSAPTQGSDYTNNKLYSINTYSGCGNSSFNGDVVAIGCSGSGPAGGKVSFTAEQDVYIVIKAGSSTGSLGDTGVTVNDVVLKPQ